MFYLISLPGLLWGSCDRHEFTSEDASSLIYYTSFPQQEEKFPIVILVDGSYARDQGPDSVKRFMEYYGETFKEAKMGFLVLERRGVDADQVDHEKFHFYNIPSQRLDDHLSLVVHLKENPPEFWNGKLFIMGASEGGPIAIKISHKIKADACVVMVGCGDQSFKDYIWQHLVYSSQNIQHLNIVQRLYYRFYFWYQDIPQSRDEYERHCKMMKENPLPEKFWYGQSYKYWAHALDQTETEEFSALQCPTYVIMGGKDLEVESTKRLLQANKKPNIQSYCIEEAGHDVLNPKCNLLPKIISFLVSLD